MANLRSGGNGSAAGMAQDESTQLLAKGQIGRLGVSADGESYVVPVAYAYEDRRIYARLAPGHKLDLLREAPDSACFEVDALAANGSCHRVNAWGPVSELHGVDAEHALALLLRHSMASTQEALPRSWIELAGAHPGEPAVIAMRVLETDLLTIP
jgi:nitroimidazol reductase NimA-like FMN-containing flavoprotein (pyridoxamine 5'-phosphate oxidase superfamily)